MSRFSEKRRSARRAVDMFIEETLDDRTYLHPAIDLSVHGVYLMASDDRRAVDGERTLNLAFTLPSGHAVSTEGRVVQVDDHRGQRGLRVAFVDMDDAHREAIRAYLDKLEADEPLAQAG
ncbi:MAG: PilZ domain-containing protein [Myxococcota bacterium]